MSEPLRMHTSYMSYAHKSWRKVLAQARLHLDPQNYDTLVGTGLSGAILIPRLAGSLRKNWLMVRKPGDGSHSFSLAEGTLGSRWVFVDDLIDSGTTFDRVTDAVKDICESRKHKTTFVGAYLYQRGGQWQSPSAAGGSTY